MNDIEYIERFSDGILFEEIIYKNIEKEEKKGIIDIKYKNSILTIETPMLKIPFGIRKINGYEKYFLQISIDNKYEKNKDFITFMYMLEKHAKEKVSNICKRKKYSTSFYHKDNFPPLINLYLKKNTKIINDKDDILSLKNYLNKSFKAKIEFNYEGIWYNDNKYGLSFKIEKIKIKEDENNIKIIF